MFAAASPHGPSTPQAQVSLFGSGEPHIDSAFTTLDEIELGDGAWLDLAPGWLVADEVLLEALAESVPWDQPVVKMYDRDVRTPRLVGRVPHDAHPVVGEMIEVLSDRYEVRLDQVSAGWYRDGSDSVSWHGDRIARNRDTATVATVSLGHPRRFLIRPKEGGKSQGFSLGHGDLVVMRGTCQRTWRHSVPKVANAGPRIALMFRHTYG